jgi:arginine-tRNA-protein transferase
VRIPVQHFAPSRTLRKTATRNQDLQWARADAQDNDELFNLFLSYQLSRHGDSDMARMNRHDFTAMLTEGNADTRLYQLRDRIGILQACIIGDFVGDGISAVYSFFNTADPRRSLGTQLVLSLVGEAQNTGLPYIYLGYWIAQSRKMAYKSRFKPLQSLGPHGWAWIEEGDKNANT